MIPYMKRDARKLKIIFRQNMIFLILNLLMVSPSTGNFNENVTVAPDLSFLEDLGLGKRDFTLINVSCIDKSIIVWLESRQDNECKIHVCM